MVDLMEHVLKMNDLGVPLGPPVGSWDLAAVEGWEFDRFRGSGSRQQGNKHGNLHRDGRINQNCQ